MKPKEYELVSTFEFANDRAFKVTRVKGKQVHVVEDLKNGNLYPASSYSKALANVRFMANISHRTENTSGWRG